VQKEKIKITRKRDTFQRDNSRFRFRSKQLAIETCTIFANFCIAPMILAGDDDNNSNSNSNNKNKNRRDKYKGQKWKSTLFAVE